MASFGLVFIMGLIGLLSMVASAILARLDAGRGRRQFGKRVLFIALAASLVFVSFVGVMLILFLIERPSGPTVQLGVSVLGIAFLTGLVFLWSALAASVGYAISFRIFNRGVVVDPIGADAEPDVRMDETGNPYQPPST